MNHHESGNDIYEMNQYLLQIYIFFSFDINIGIVNVNKYHYFVYIRQNKKSNENIEVLYLIYRLIGR